MIKEKECKDTIYLGAIYGIILGCVIFYILKKFRIMIDVSASYLNSCVSLRNYRFDYIFDARIMIIRSVTILFIIQGVRMFRSSIFDYCLFVFFGIYYGLTVCYLISEIGLFGSFLGLCIFFPHFYFYYLAYKRIRKMLCRGGTDNKGNRYDVTRRQQFSKIFVIFLFCFIGEIYEVLLQKNIINFFYQHIV